MSCALGGPPLLAAPSSALQRLLPSRQTGLHRVGAGASGSTASDLPSRRRQRRQQQLRQAPRSAWGRHEPPPKDLSKDPEAKFRQ